MSILLMLAVLVAVTVVPVMIAARLLGAQRSGLFPALFAVIVQSALYKLVQHYAGGEVAEFLLSVLGSTLVFMFILGTSFVRALLLGVLVLIIQVLVILALAGTVYGLAGGG